MYPASSFNGHLDLQEWAFKVQRVGTFEYFPRQVMACRVGISKGNIKYKSVSEKEVTLNSVVILRLIHYYSPNNLINILGFLDFI